MFSDVIPCGLVATWHYIQKRPQLSIIYSAYLLLLVCLLCSRWQDCCIATSSATHCTVLSSVIKNTVCRNSSQSLWIIMEHFWYTLMVHGRFYCNLVTRIVQTQGLTGVTSSLCRVIVVLSVGHSNSCSCSYTSWLYHALRVLFWLWMVTLYALYLIRIWGICTIIFPSWTSVSST